ncbi:MAG: hypothetical protein KGR26_03840 [Cyanobacteria bacterium REEB65]|nr:hypothetical protein [Cyanobacteria bacterium REEB65]
MNPVVLFVCNRNSGRSQIAESYFRHLVGDRASCISAGYEPAAAVDPTVAAAMREVGVMLVSEPKKLAPEMLARADRIISMGCQPVPERATDVWDLPDPAGKSLDEVRMIRDQIRARIEVLLTDLGVAHPGASLAGS